MLRVFYGHPVPFVAYRQVGAFEDFVRRLQLQSAGVYLFEIVCGLLSEQENPLLGSGAERGKLFPADISCLGDERKYPDGLPEGGQPPIIQGARPGLCPRAPELDYDEWKDGCYEQKGQVLYDFDFDLFPDRHASLPLRYGIFYTKFSPGL